MRDLNSAASVVKSISFNHCLPWCATISNRYFLGFGSYQEERVGMGGGFVTFFEKSTLFSDSSATGESQIHLHTTNLPCHKVASNTTSLVFYREERDDQGRVKKRVLAKKDFWMTNNILPVPLMGHNNCAVL